MTNKTAKKIYIVWQAIFGIPAFLWIGRTLYRMATMPVPEEVGVLGTTLGAMLAFLIIALIALIALIPTAWYDSRRIG